MSKRQLQPSDVLMFVLRCFVYLEISRKVCFILCVHLYDIHVHVHVLCTCVGPCSHLVAETFDDLLEAFWTATCSFPSHTFNLLAYIYLQHVHVYNVSRTQIIHVHVHVCRTQSPFSDFSFLVISGKLNNAWGQGHNV